MLTVCCAIKIGIIWHIMLLNEIQRQHKRQVLLKNHMLEKELKNGRKPRIHSERFQFKLGKNEEAFGLLFMFLQRRRKRFFPNVELF